MQIRLASSTDLAPLSQLFDLYRQQLNQPADYSACHAFLSHRLAENDTMIFVCIKDDVMVGFTQLYPSFSSLLLSPVWYLEDVYVVPEYQQTDVAELMYQKAEQLAQSTGVLLINHFEAQHIKALCSA
ncbi:MULTISPECIES: GNAT family N-acetyltransferase [Shewanella]|uniref:GNAT family N-acetyltransferase n=1 Tax=Shewanella metallivivens TaxID=2872342 RepID=A0ABT5TIV7_9GAMM|nr:GNAT family N-acetyltransferase [Shewanella metallivivens]MDD8057839.1 GNAT family N-acetyltransferase [Shewanella metallivivens]